MRERGDKREAREAAGPDHTSLPPRLEKELTYYSN